MFSWGRKQADVPEKKVLEDRMIYSELKNGEHLQIKRENWDGAVNAYILDKFLNIKDKERIP